MIIFGCLDLIVPEKIVSRQQVFFFLFYVYEKLSPFYCIEMPTYTLGQTRPCSLKILYLICTQKVCVQKNHGKEFRSIKNGQSRNTIKNHIDANKKRTRVQDSKYQNNRIIYDEESFFFVVVSILFYFIYLFLDLFFCACRIIYVHRRIIFARFVLFFFGCEEASFLCVKF